MKRCKCCRQDGPRSDYSVRGALQRGAIPYICPIDGYTYVTSEGLWCADTCATVLDPDQAHE